jgi:periplasmic protein TonB
VELNLTLHPSASKAKKQAAQSMVRNILAYSPAHFAAHLAQGEEPTQSSHKWMLLLVVALHIAIAFYVLLHVSVKPEPIVEVPIVVSLLNEIPQAPIVKPEQINKPQPTVQKTKPTPPKLDRLPVSQTPMPQPVVSESKINNPVPEVSHEQATAEAKPSESKVAPEVEKPAPKEDVVEPPKFGVAYLNNPKPNYPNLSRRTGERGRVLLKVLVDANGLPATVELGTSSGFERLDNAALEAVKQWRFVPARKSNQAISAWVTVPINFALD